MHIEWENVLAEADFFQGLWIFGFVYFKVLDVGSDGVLEVVRELLDDELVQVLEQRIREEGLELELAITLAQVLLSVEGLHVND